MVARVKAGHCGGKLSFGRFVLTAEAWIEVPEGCLFWVRQRQTYGEVEVLDTMPQAATSQLNGKSMGGRVEKPGPSSSKTQRGRSAKRR